MGTSKTGMPDLELEFDVDVRWEDDDQCYVARAEMFPDLQGLGTTPKQAIESLMMMVERWWEACKYGGKLPTSKY